MILKDGENVLLYIIDDRIHKKSLGLHNSWLWYCINHWLFDELIDWIQTVDCVVDTIHIVFQNSALEFLVTDNMD